MTINVTRTITLAMAIGIGLTACGGSDTADSNSGELGGVGHWTNLQLCALTTPAEISAEFGVDVDEQPAIDSPEWSRCRWNQQNVDPLAPPLMSVDNDGPFTSDSLGGDEQLDIAGADMAAYSDNIGGAANVTAVVGDQLLEVTSPVPATAARQQMHEVRYTDATGAERAVVIEVRQPIANRATSPVVVWSHGGSTGKTSPARVATEWGKEMNQADFVFVAVAHPGRSDESRRALCDALAVETCAEFKYLLWDRLRDAQAVFDWLEHQAAAGELFIDLDRLVYGGHSAGAMAVMVMAGMDSPYTTAVPMPTDIHPAAFLVASPPGAEVNGLDASSFSALDRPMLLLTGNGDTTDATVGTDRLALFDMIESDQVMLVSTASEFVGHSTFGLKTQPCRRAGGSREECRETVRALARTAQEFLRSALGASGLEPIRLVADVNRRLPNDMELR